MSYTFNPFTGNLDVTPFSLDGAGKIPSNYLPSYVDDVVEYDDLAGFPGTGETGKIYVAKDTGYTYRWTGSVYVRIGSGGEVGLNLGSEGSPSLFFNGDANTGLYSPGADQVAISTAGVGRLFVDSSGNVGIGRTSPGEKLDIVSTSGNCLIKMQAPVGSVSGFNSIGSNILAFQTGFFERMRIDSSGNVGIGTSSPAGPLHVSSSIAASTSITNANSQLIIQSGAGSGTNNRSTIYLQPLNSSGNGSPAAISALASGNTNSDLAFYTNPSSNYSGTPTERLRIDSSGNVGIGTTSPAVDLHVFGKAGSNTAIRIHSADGGTESGDFAWDNTSNLLHIGTNSTYPFALYTNDQERARIDSSGRLLVGTSSALSTSSGHIIQAADSTGVKLTLGRSSTSVAADVGLAQLIGYSNGGGTYEQSGSIAIFSDGAHASGDKPGRLVFSTTADGASTPTERMRITSDGNISFGPSGYGVDFQNTVSINPLDGLISFGMDGREGYVTGAAGCYIYSGSGPGGTTTAGELILQSRSNQPRSITFVTGSTPTKRMEIDGSGGVTVVGAFSKGSGSFRIDHPLPEKKETHHLVHSFIEGPQADLIYRGHVQLVNGVAAVNLDEAARMTEGTFEALCTNVCCFTSNESDWTAVRGSVSGNILTIEAQDPASNADVCWLVIGERKDQHMLDTDWTDENGRVITEPLKQQPVAEAD